MRKMTLSRNQLPKILDEHPFWQRKGQNARRGTEILSIQLNWFGRVENVFDLQN